MGQAGTDGHSTGQGQLQTDAPTAEVRERHQAAPADPQHFAQHNLRIAKGLQRFFKHHNVKKRIGEAEQAQVQVRLNDRDAARHAGFDGAGIQFHALAAHFSQAGQPFQQYALAAPKVEYGGADRNQLFDPLILPAYGRRCGAACRLTQMANQGEQGLLV